MTHADFDNVLNRRLELSRIVLASKAGEYAVGGDRLHNFKRSASVRGNGRTPSQVCIDFMTKHLTSIFDLVDAGKPVTQVVID